MKHEHFNHKYVIFSLVATSDSDVILEEENLTFLNEEFVKLRLLNREVRQLTIC